jgi:hypothetical protein
MIRINQKGAVALHIIIDEEDVKDLAETMGATLTTTEVKNVLHFLDDTYDPEEGITWNHIIAAIEIVIDDRE